MDTASRIGFRVAIENVFDDDPEALQMLIEKIDNRDFGFCFDTGHFNLFSRVPLEQWFMALGRHLVEVHLHDNDGKTDAHLAIGSGNIDFKTFFVLMKAHAPIPVFTIEAHDKDDIETSLEQAKMLMNSQ